MVDCFMCGKPAAPEYGLIFEVPGKESKRVVFCQKCSGRVGGWIRMMRRLMETGEVVRG